MKLLPFIAALEERDPEFFQVTKERDRSGNC